VQIIVELEEEKTRMARDHVKSVDSMKEHIMVQRVEEIMEKVTQVRSKWEELEEKFHSLTKVAQGARTT
jgi:hypothetical protein